MIVLDANGEICRFKSKHFRISIMGLRLQANFWIATARGACIREDEDSESNSRVIDEIVLIIREVSIIVILINAIFLSLLVYQKKSHYQRVCLTCLFSKKKKTMLSLLFLYIRRVYVLQVCSSFHSFKSRYVKNGWINSIPWCTVYGIVSSSLSATTSIKTDRVWWCGFEWCM